MLTPTASPPVPEQRVLTPALHPSLKDKAISWPKAKKCQPVARLAPPYPSRCSHRIQSHHPSEPMAQTATNAQDMHHISVLAATPSTAGKQGSLKKLLLGPVRKLGQKASPTNGAGSSPTVSAETAPNPKESKAPTPLSSSKSPKSHSTVRSPICQLRLHSPAPKDGNPSRSHVCRPQPSRLPRQPQLSHRFHARRKDPHQQHHF